MRRLSRELKKKALEESRAQFMLAERDTFDPTKNQKKFAKAEESR